MATVAWETYVTGLSVDAIGGSEYIPVIDVATAKYITPDLMSDYTIDQIVGAAAITTLTDTHQLPVFTSGDDEKTITFANVSAWIMDEIEALSTGSTIVSGDTLLHVDGGVLKQIDIDDIVAFVNSENGTLGAQVDALSTATLADTDEYMVEQGGVAAKTLWTAIAARAHSQFLAYQQGLDAVVAIADADTFYVDDGGTAKKVTADVLADYMLAEIKTEVLESAWDDYAALGGVAADADVFLLERTNTGKTVTGANLASYVVGTQDSLSNITPAAAGDDFLMWRSGTEYKVDIDVLGTYILASAWGYASGNPVATGDEVMIGRAGTTYAVTVDQLQTFVLDSNQANVLDFSGLSADTPASGDTFVFDDGAAKKITLANLETQLWADFDAYVTALTAVVTPVDADVFYVIQGGTPKKVTADVFVSYIDDELWADSLAAGQLASVTTGDDIMVRRSGVSYVADIDVLATYINTSVQATVLDYSGLSADTPAASDTFAFDDGAAKKITLANLETQLWTDFETYVDGLTENTTATGSDKFYCIQSGTPKWVDPDTLATFFDVPDGDVTGPVTTTEDNVPQWDSTTKLLKDGLSVVTTITPGAMLDTQLPTAQAVDEYYSGAGVDIDGLTDIGAALTDADLLIVDDGATGVNRKSTLSRLWTYITSKIQALTAKATPVAADILMIQDSAASNALKELTVGNLWDNRYASTGLATGAGTGITEATGESYVAGVERVGSFFRTTIVIDLAGLRSTASGDIIGNDGTSNPCYIGQITAAKNGTIFAGKIECLETPAGGDPDIDLYSATEATGTEDDAISGLTETQLIDAGDHAADAFKSLTAFPAADEYLYLVAGDTTDADYTTGILKIELWGK